MTNNKCKNASWPAPGILNSTIQTIWNKRSKIIIECEQKGTRIKRFWKHETSDVVEALVKWLKEDTSDNVPMNGPLLLATFVLINFNFKLMQVFSVTLYGSLQL